jgi:hypothetical protein
MLRKVPERVTRSKLTKSEVERIDMLTLRILSEHRRSKDENRICLGDKTYQKLVSFHYPTRSTKQESDSSFENNTTP